MSPPDFVVHHPEDTVGVVVVETVTGEQPLDGWVMDTNASIAAHSREPIPLGHKIALHDIAIGETVVKYGHDIGRAVAPIQAGAHVHVHNLKTKRW